MQIIRPTKIQPLFNKVVTTMEMYEDNVMKNGIIQKTRGNLKEIQKVVSVGDMVRSMKPGDLVAINLKNYAKKKHNPDSIRPDIIGDNPVVEYNPPIIVIDNVPHLMLEDRDIDYIVVESELEEAEVPTIVQPGKSSIIT